MTSLLSITPIRKWDFRVPSVEAADIQGIRITYEHYLPRGGEGLVVSIKYREIIPQPHRLTYDRLPPNISTSLSFSGTQQTYSYF